jgi:hypothetical protein
MRETWLNTNRRAILFGCVAPALIAAIGAWITLATGAGQSWRWLGIVLLLAGFGTVAILFSQLLRPRIAFQNGHVLFYLRSGPPFAVPMEIVEAFFAGQSPAHLPGLTKQPQTVNLIARLSQRHTEWAEQQTVNPSLGKWSESYVTIRGTWCEPLEAEVIRRLNRRLKEVKDAAKPATQNA